MVIRPAGKGLGKSAVVRPSSPAASSSAEASPINPKARPQASPRNHGQDNWKTENRQAQRGQQGRQWWQEQQQAKAEEAKKKAEEARKKAEEEKEKRKEAAKLREKIQDAQKKFFDQVKAESIDDAIAAAKALKEFEVHPQNQAMERLMEVAAKRGSQSEFARTVAFCSEHQLKVDVVYFVRLLMSMVQRGAPQIMLRMALNMPLPTGAPEVPLLPPIMDEEEEVQAFEDGEVLLDDGKEKKLEAPDTKGHPLAMVLLGCTARPELNGPYVFTDAYAEYLEHQRPTYRKGEGEFYVYFWEADEEAETGWCMGAEVGGEEMLAFNPDKASQVPPKTGWKWRKPGAEVQEEGEGGFVPPEEAPKEKGSVWPEELVFCSLAGDTQSAALTGTYKKVLEYGEYLEHDRPVYVKAGKDNLPTLYTYYWQDDPDKPWKSGWWIGQEVGGDLVCGFNPRHDWVPPHEDWSINQYDDEGACQRRPFRGGFYHKEPDQNAKKDERFESLEETVRKIDLKCLMGMVGFPDASTQAYFGHFCVLQHLEYLKELAGVRRRVTKRDLSSLVKTGWALDQLPVKAQWGKKNRGKWDALPGKDNVGREQVAFGVPSDFDLEQSRFRRGDSVMVSAAGCTTPLLEKVAEGIVHDLNEWQMVVALEGHMPDDARRRQWRLDKSANNVAYERQLGALLKLAKYGMNRNWADAARCLSAGVHDHGAFVSALLMKIPVGVVDEWASKMKERVEQMQAEKLKEKGMDPPEDDKWLQWLESDAGGADTKPALELKPIEKGKAAGKAAGQQLEQMSIAQLAALGPKSNKQSLHAARTQLGGMKDLNMSQRRAINAALSNRITVIQGPPGTGKTHVSVKLLTLFGREFGLGPLLACSDSNVAVDNICQGLVADGIKSVRVGRPEKVRAQIEEVTLEVMCKRKKEELKVEAAEAERQIQKQKIEAEANKKKAAADKAQKERQAVAEKAKKEREAAAEKAKKEREDAAEKAKKEREAAAEKVKKEKEAAAEKAKRDREAREKTEKEKQGVVKADVDGSAASAEEAEEPPAKKPKISQQSETPPKKPSSSTSSSDSAESKAAAKQEAAAASATTASSPERTEKRPRPDEEVPSKTPPKGDWLRRLLSAAEMADLYDKANIWKDDTGCIESDIHDDEVLQSLIEHLELKLFPQKRLRKAVAALSKSATPEPAGAIAGGSSGSGGGPARPQSPGGGGGGGACGGGGGGKGSSASNDASLQLAVDDLINEAAAAAGAETLSSPGSSVTEAAVAESSSLCLNCGPVTDLEGANCATCGEPVQESRPAKKRRLPSGRGTSAEASSSTCSEPARTGSSKSPGKPRQGSRSRSRDARFSRRSKAGLKEELPVPAAASRPAKEEVLTGIIKHPGTSIAGVLAPKKTVAHPTSAPSADPKAAEVKREDVAVQDPYSELEDMFSASLTPEKAAEEPLTAEAKADEELSAAKADDDDDEEQLATDLDLIAAEKALAAEATAEEEKKLLAVEAKRAAEAKAAPGHKEKEPHLKAAAEGPSSETKADEEHIAAEAKAVDERLAAEAKAEEKRLAAEAKAEEELAAKAKAEEERLAAKAKAEEERLAAEKKAEEERIAAEAKAEEERLAEEAKAEEERLAAEARAEEERLAREAEKVIIKAQEAKKKQRMEDWELQMELIAEAEVVCTTTIAAGGDFLNKLMFEAILIDEAAQATELSTIVPVVLRGTNRLVIVGDHCQLPPTISSLEAETRGLSVSVYSRLVGCGIEPHFLNIQYRSHPKIAEFSSSAFYGGMLKSGVTAEKRTLPKGFAWPNAEVPICFVDVADNEGRDGDTKVNRAEAKRVSEIVRAIVNAGELNIFDVGVVTPYAGQVRLLRKELRQVLQPLLTRQYNTNWGQPWSHYDAKSLEIGSVDAYQGREKEIIVFSAVRSNSHGRMGFLADWRRLNVMLTRARRGLIVVGNANTLRYDTFWQQWLEWCETNECIQKMTEVTMDSSAPVEQGDFAQRLGPMKGKSGKGKWKGKGKGKWRQESSQSSGQAWDPQKRWERK